MSDPADAPPILLVEDDDNDIVLIQRALRRAGSSVDLHFVRDGEQAITYLSGGGPYADRARHPLPALILLDLILPRRSGHDVLEWIGEQPGLKRIPVIVLTSSMEPEDVNKAYDLCANSCLSKPATFEAFTDLIRTLHTYWLTMNERPAVEV